MAGSTVLAAVVTRRSPTCRRPRSRLWDRYLGYGAAVGGHPRVQRRHRPGHGQPESGVVLVRRYLAPGQGQLSAIRRAARQNRSPAGDPGVGGRRDRLRARTVLGDGHPGRVVDRRTAAQLGARRRRPDRTGRPGHRRRAAHARALPTRTDSHRPRRAHDPHRSGALDPTVEAVQRPELVNGAADHLLPGGGRRYGRANHRVGAAGRAVQPI